MDDQLSALETAFEDGGYAVLEVTRNRNQVRAVLEEDRADAEQVRAIAADAFADDDLLGVNVTTESIEGQDGMNTVVTCRVR
ncbi:hypothetical protein [Halapricum desulfuricans]|uniref:Uncharacterized protein n=1 Tax=Halapricum desulfuricans TaxID=2841257 RepID=A0A897NZU8_9EURY|nr:hypothetical protein [Halapricum desulfuricans]QSG04755.1 Uncharacterized protein HSR121_0399 [Halapricum desulfuricans]QSG15566.1 Uncharacterized protein HSEST_2048 [Halapricum desulfuricans]